MSGLGNKIRKIREIKGFSQEYVGGKLGLTQRAYSKMELGETKITWDRILELAKIMELEPADLIDFDETKIFHNCTQSGNDVQTINYNTSLELESAYNSQIETLKEEVLYLRELNRNLLALPGKKG